MNLYDRAMMTLVCVAIAAACALAAWITRDAAPLYGLLVVVLVIYNWPRC